MKFINLTPHDVTISNPYITITFPPSGIVARVEPVTDRKPIELTMEGGMKVSIPCQTTPKVKVINLPEPKEGIIYIVSARVAQIVKRTDLVSPLTDNTAERDENGEIQSVKTFQSFAEDREIVFEYNPNYQVLKEEILKFKE